MDLKEFIHAIQLCQIYFDIAAEIIGEQKVRELRDKKIDEMLANPVENRVGFAEPNQQLFTVDEVTELLKEQRRLCGLLVYENCGVWERETKMKIPSITFQQTAEKAPEPNSKKLSEARSN